MSALAIVIGLVLSATADIVNTLVTTSTSLGRWWLTSILYRRAWRALRAIASSIEQDSTRERLLATFLPVSVLMLLSAWVV